MLYMYLYIQYSLVGFVKLLLRAVLAAGFEKGNSVIHSLCLINVTNIIQIQFKCIMFDGLGHSLAVIIIGVLHN